MYQFFVEDDQIGAQEIVIRGSDCNHIKNVLRMKPGERIRVSSRTSGRSFFADIVQLAGNQVVAKIAAADVDGTELPCPVTLYQGLPKGDKMELIIQKATELGVVRIIPVCMKNCVVHLDDKKAENKVRRWQAIAESAAKQAKRTVIPAVELPVTWNRLLEEITECDRILVPYENARGMEATRESLRSIKKGESVAIVIGPEGGFAPREIEQLPPNADRISLGRRILRTETAGLAALAMLLYEIEE